MRWPTRYSEFERFQKLRACWTIMRGGSVAWKLDISGNVTSLSGPSLWAGCLVDGEPLAPRHISHVNPEQQP